MHKSNDHLFTCIVTSLLLLSFPGCVKNTSSDPDLVGNWIKSSDFDGNARSEGVVFTIGDKAYLTTGTTDRDRFRDLWEYDVEKKFWSQKADLDSAAPARYSAVGFSVNNLGYIGTGYDGNNKLNDIWQYNPATNKWTKKNDFPGSARYDAVAFTVGTKSYIAAGFDGNYLKDLWEYNSASDTWIQKASIGGSKRSGATAFVLENKAYVCSGTNNGTTLNDLWMYDPASDSWTEKRKLSNVTDESYDDNYSILRSNAVSFVMADKAYVTTGEAGQLATDTWEYDPSKDEWLKKTGFEGSGRIGAVAFTLKQRGFVVTGRSGSLSFDNMYEFNPAATYNKND